MGRPCGRVSFFVEFLAVFVNLEMLENLELSYEFQTLHGGQTVCTSILNMLSFNHKLLCDTYNYPINVIFGILIPMTTKYNVISEASL